MDIEMIEYLMYLDSDQHSLRGQRNIFDKLPIDLDTEKILAEYTTTIWDRAKYDVKMIRECLSLNVWGINEQTFEFKNTPLHIAVYNQNIPVIKYFLRKGADVTLKNYKGETPIDSASNKRSRGYNQEVIEIFREHCESQGIEHPYFKQ